MSQKQEILAHLKAGKGMTPIDALSKFGCLRLGARIYELRGEGYNILAQRYHTPNGAIVARYKLI